MATVTLHRDNSAFTNKAETFYDTIKTVEQMQPDLIVIRSPITAYYEDLTNVAVPIINGGDGTGRHPTQSLLDLYTIYAEYGGDLKDKQVLYIGDILHSRVAKTGIMLMKKFGMQV